MTATFENPLYKDFPTPNFSIQKVNELGVISAENLFV